MVKIMVRLDKMTTTDEIQNAVGMVKSNQLPWAFRTKNALVQPPNIIHKLAIATHINNLWGWMRWRWLDTVFIIVLFQATKVALKVCKFNKQLLCGIEKISGYT